MQTTIAIGCLIQWYEVEIVEEYVDSLIDAIKAYQKESVYIDLKLTLNQNLEKATSIEELNFCEDKIKLIFDTKLKDYNFNLDITSELVTIADYRRQFNDSYCDKVDVLVWGETDMLVPKEMFTTIDLLHSNISDKTPKYLLTYGICKMWDESWKPLEHPKFTNKPFIENDTSNWWSLRYVMSKDEMDSINQEVEDLELKKISPHKFNGCGLVISSEVIKAGVNIPKSVFFVHEDTAFMLMTQKVLGDIPQYHISNILLVHNRKHPKKRSFVKNEEGLDKTNTGLLRKQHTWYSKANKYSEENAYRMFDPTFKSYTWEDVFK